MTRDRQLAYLQAMDIQVWQVRHAPVIEEAVADVVEPVPAEAEAPPAPATQEPAGNTATIPPATPVGPVVADMGWSQLQETVRDCRLCELHESRMHTVFGTGNRNADWLVIGEAPGKDEDLQGEPFVGRAGQLLNAMLQATGLQREQVYIANILKCRPPNNRDPGTEEVQCCSDYLARQIALVNPTVILAVGRIAAQNLLGTDTPIGKLRGKVHHFGETGIPVIATYHPAYLLRSPLEKRKAWQDLQLAVATGKACQP